MIHRVDPARAGDLDRWLAVWATVRPGDARSRVELLVEVDLDRRTGLWLVLDESARPIGGIRLSDSRWTGEHEPVEARVALFPGHERLLPRIIETLRDEARTWGASGLAVVCRDTRADLGLRTLLLDRGYRCVQRDVEAVLDVASATGPRKTHVANVEIATLAGRPDLAHSAHRCFELADADEPSQGQADRRPFADWIREYSTPWATLEDCLIAVIDGEVVGWANLERFSAEPATGWNGFTGTHPDYRGRGIATALKRHLLEHARARGLTRLRTENVEGNVPMRRINARMGYVPSHANECWHSPA